jgi:hypothetical protein
VVLAVAVMVHQLTLVVAQQFLSRLPYPEHQTQAVVVVVGSI